MNSSIRILFFGSTSDSVLVLSRLVENGYSPVTVVTQPPAPVGRKQVMTPTPVEIFAKKHALPVLSFPADVQKPWLYQNEKDVINALSTYNASLLISACYGQKIPQQLIRKARFGGLNVHPSLLPRWRGADPVPWAILAGDNHTGVTIVSLAEKFDEGVIVAQKKIRISESDFSDPLRTKLFRLGADLLISSLPDYISGKNRGEKQNFENRSYARKFSRNDGFVPWDHIQTALEGRDISKEKRTGLMQYIRCHLAFGVARMVHALSPWPGVWTLINIKNQKSCLAGRQAKIKSEEKRVKILSAHTEGIRFVIDTVQLEGKKPVRWEQFKKSYL